MCRINVHYRFVMTYMNLNFGSSGPKRFFSFGWCMSLFNLFITVVVHLSATFDSWKKMRTYRECALFLNFG